jgi:hypothetical protein
MVVLVVGCDASKIGRRRRRILLGPNRPVVISTYARPVVARRLPVIASKFDSHFVVNHSSVQSVIGRDDLKLTSAVHGRAPAINR